eukprot:5879472-Pyramimonas_sp.AAC.1
MHRAMYDSQFDGERLVPGPKAKFDPELKQQQAACFHPADELKWQSNGTVIFAKCKKCSSKS